jgi:hypothetical protein
MKKSLFLLAFSVVVVSTAAFSQVKIGGQVHGNLSSGYWEVNQPVSLSQSAKVGYGAGIVSEIGISDRFALRPSLNFMKRGVKMTGKSVNPEGPGNVEATMDANLNYLELPVVLAYNIPLKDSKVYFGLGPQAGYGIYGKSKMTYSIISPNGPVLNETEKVASFKKEDKGGVGFKRFDVSATALAGIQFNSGLFVNASGIYGLTDNMEGAGKYQGRSVALTVGFLLN